MNVCGCEMRCRCLLVSVLASLVIGIAAAFLQIAALITVTPTFYWVTLGIGVGVLIATLFATSLVRRDTACGRSALRTVLFGALGTILLSLILLAVGFAATSILGAFVFGVLLFFLTLTTTSVACYTTSQITCDECSEES